VQIHEFLKFLSKKAAATVKKKMLPLPRRAATMKKKMLPLPRRYGHSGSGSGSGSGSAAMDISVPCSHTHPRAFLMTDKKFYSLFRFLQKFLKISVNLFRKISYV
jgi:hypothetical protein